VAAGISVAVLLLLAGSITVLRVSTPSPAASLAISHQTRDIWKAKEAALRHRLQIAPGDDHTRVRLIGMLTAQALLDALESSDPWAAEPAPYAAGSMEYEDQQVIGSLQFSPQLAEAQALAERVARQSGNNRLRACAWAELARMRQLLGRRTEGIACMEAAVREDPAWKRTLASLKWNGR
jgi:hypothetical protein